MSKHNHEKPEFHQSDADTSRLTAELLQKTYWEGSNLVFKGTAFYIGILAAFGWYVTQRVPSQNAALALYAGIATSVLAVTVAIVSGRALHRCVTLLEKLFRASSAHGLTDEDIESLFRRWRLVIWSFGICGIILVGVFVTGILVLFDSLDHLRSP